MGLQIVCENRNHHIHLSQKKVVIKVAQMKKQTVKQIEWARKAKVDLSINKPKIESMRLRNTHFK